MWKYDRKNGGYDSLTMMLARVLWSFPKSEQTQASETPSSAYWTNTWISKGVSRPAAPAPPENLLETQHLGPHHQSTESETLGVVARDLCFNRALWVILELPKLETTSPEKMTDNCDKCEARSHGPHSSRWFPAQLATMWLSKTPFTSTNPWLILTQSLWESGGETAWSTGMQEVCDLLKLSVC